MHANHNDTDRLSSYTESLGISPTTHVVLSVPNTPHVLSIIVLTTDLLRYDTQGVFSSPRALFAFRAFGHQNSSVLDGGLPRWEAEGLPLITTSRLTTADPVTSYPEPALDQRVLRSASPPLSQLFCALPLTKPAHQMLGYEDVVANAELDPSSSSAAELVLDARSAGR